MINNFLFRLKEHCRHSAQLHRRRLRHGSHGTTNAARSWLEQETSRCVPMFHWTTYRSRVGLKRYQVQYQVPDTRYVISVIREHLASGAVHSGLVRVHEYSSTALQQRFCRGELTISTVRFDRGGVGVLPRGCRFPVQIIVKTWCCPQQCFS